MPDIMMVGGGENSTIVWHEMQQGRQGKLSLISYVVNTKSKGKKNILVLCSVPNLATLGVTSDDGHVKPAAIKVYDFSKGGTDIVDQRVDGYTTATKSKRWPRKTYTLDVTRTNAQSVFCIINGKNPRSGVDSFRFAWELAEALILPHMKLRKEKGKNSLSKLVKTKMGLFLPQDQEAAAGDGQAAGQAAADGQASRQADNRQDQAAGINNNLFPHICHANDRKR